MNLRDKTVSVYQQRHKFEAGNPPTSDKDHCACVLVLEQAYIYMHKTKPLI